MSRNGSGTYSKVNTFAAGTTITASDHNENWDDLETEMTNSVAADGQTTMTGPLKAANGTAAAPSITFGSDQDSGFYRSAGNVIGAAVSGAAVLTITSSGIALEAGKTLSGLGATPVGGLMDYAGTTEPTGWLFCYGQAVSRTTYAALFTAISTTYGTGDGSTTFNLPDCRGRVAAGKDNMGGSSANRLTDVLTNGINGDTLGDTGGSESHTLLEVQIPAHTHVVVDAGHVHTISADLRYVGAALQNVAAGGSFQSLQTGVDWRSSTVSATTGITLNNTGGGDAHNIVQPTIIFNKIIFAGA